MHAIQSQHKQLGSDLEAAHAADVDKMKMGHQEELEKKITDIQQQLQSLLGLSQSYWEKHAEKHRVNFDQDQQGEDT